MNAKLNIFSKELICDTPIFSDFENLLFGMSTNGKMLFDASEYCIREQLGDFDFRKFENVYKFSIPVILDGTDVNISDIFWQNPNGHILVHRLFAIPFLRYVSPKNDMYFYSLLEDCLQDGIAFCESLIAKLAYAKLSNAVVQELAKIKNEESK